MWTNEPKQGLELGSMRNSLLKFRLGRRLISGSGLDKMFIENATKNNRFRQLFVVSCQ